MIESLLSLLGRNRGFSVRADMQGRDGAVFYSEGLHSCRFYCEYGGGDTVAIISAPKLAAWDRELPWAAGRRAEVLDRVGREVSRRHCSGCPYVVTDDGVEIRE